jgi:cytochrome c peroxidase
MRIHVVSVAACFASAFIPSAGAQSIPNRFPFLDPSGLVETSNAGSAPGSSAPIDTTGPFFQSLGTNGRSCATCHMPDQGWSIAPTQTQLRFLLTGGTDPIFRTVDGSNCDQNINVSTVAGRKSAYGLLLNRGLIRIALAVPANADFRVVSVQNPYGCSGTSSLSMYRRPLPAANLRYLNTVMWDGRESAPAPTQKITAASYPAALLTDLAHQALDAVSGHAEGNVPLSGAQQQAIVSFEMGLTTAQILDFSAGSLTGHGGNGGSANLTAQSFFIGVNDPLGQNPTNAPFTSTIFDLYDAWANFNQHDPRAAVARGQAVFNTKPIAITGVAGLNDATGQPVINGFCGTCHDTPNVGSHSVAAPLNIGVADVTNSLGVSYLPVITLQNIATGETVQTTDPGRALVTGQWADIGKFKGPILRGLAARAPYFHNGSAQSLGDVADFYNQRFGIGLTAQEKSDLIAFLKTL